MKKITMIPAVLSICLASTSACADRTGDLWVLFAGASCFAQDASFANTSYGRFLNEERKTASGQGQAAEGFEKFYADIGTCTQKLKLHTPGLCKDIGALDIRKNPHPNVQAIADAHPEEFAGLSQLGEPNCGQAVDEVAKSK